MGVLRQKIGIVPQKAVLFQGTVRENLKWGNEEADDAALWAALETAQAADVVRGKSKGLDELVDQGGRNFSGGQDVYKRQTLYMLAPSKTRFDSFTARHTQTVSGC